MRPDDDLADEVLRAGGWSRRTLGAIALAGLVVVLGLVVGLTRGGSDSSSAHSPAPSGQPSTLRMTTTPPQPMAGNDVLGISLIGGSGVTSSSVRHGRWRVTVSTDLTNYATRALAIGGPLRVTGKGVGREITVNAAELAAARYEGLGRRPPVLTVIRPAAHVELWVELTFNCRAPAPRRAPLRNLAVTVPLVGMSAPALFYFADLTSGFPMAKQPPGC